MKNAIIFSLFILLGEGDMRLILVIFTLFISQNAWSISCTEDYQKRGDDNFSFPDANYMIDR
ncbi:hypothetical protein Q4R04_17515, partial [Morganella morganii]